MKKLALLLTLLFVLTCTSALAAETVDKTSVAFPETYYSLQANAYLPYETPFSEGLAAVSIDGKIGFINTKGEIVIPAVWENAEPFRNGLSLVRGEIGYGFINTKGEQVIAPIWGYFERPSGTPGDAGDYFYNGITWVVDGNAHWGLFNDKGELLLSPQIWRRGNRDYEWTSPTFGKDDESITVAFDYSTMSWFYFNNKGEDAGMYSQMASLEYLNVDEYCNGVSEHNVFEGDGNYYLLDGTPITLEQIDSDPSLSLDESDWWLDPIPAIGSWQDPNLAFPGGNRFFAYQDSTSGSGRSLIDSSGTPLCPDTFDIIGVLDAKVHLIDGEYYLCQSNQGNLYRIEPDKITQVSNYRIPIFGGILEHDHLKGLCKDGTPIAGLDADAVVCYGGFLNNRLLILSDSKYTDARYGLVNIQGELIRNPYWYRVERFDEDTVLVKGDNGEGLLDSHGHTIIPEGNGYIISVNQGIVLVENESYTFHSVKEGSKRLGNRKWDYAEPFSSNRAYVEWTQGGTKRKGFINTKGEIVITLPEDFVPGKNGYVFFDEMLMYTQDGQYGFMDRGGKLAVKAQWDDASNFNGDRAIVWKDGEWFIIDRHGKVIY